MEQELHREESTMRHHRTITTACTALTIALIATACGDDEGNRADVETITTETQSPDTSMASSATTETTDDPGTTETNGSTTETTESATETTPTTSAVTRSTLEKNPPTTETTSPQTTETTAASTTVPERDEWLEGTYEFEDAKTYEDEGWKLDATFTLHNITFTPSDNAVYVEFTLESGKGAGERTSTGLDSSELIPDGSDALDLAPPVGRLFDRINPGETITGQLAFTGRVPSDAPGYLFTVGSYYTEFVPYFEYYIEVNDAIRSDLEKRVAEVIEEYDGEVSEAGTTLTIPAEVLFDPEQAALREGAREDLDKILEVLNYYGDASAQVTGHTDTDGSDAYNQDLSEQRAKAVVSFLTDNGIDPATITSVGRGEAEPVAANDTPANKQLNRRVEILVEGVEPPDVD